MTFEAIVFYFFGAAAVVILCLLLTEVRTAAVLSLCVAGLGGSLSVLVALLGATYLAVATLMVGVGVALVFLLFAALSWGWGSLELSWPSPLRVSLKLAGALAALALVGVLASLLPTWLPVAEISSGDGARLGLSLFGQTSQPLYLLGCLMLVALVGGVLLSEGGED